MLINIAFLFADRTITFQSRMLKKMEKLKKEKMTRIDRLYLSQIIIFHHLFSCLFLFSFDLPT